MDKPLTKQNWNRSKPGYRSIHLWVQRTLGSPKLCSDCSYTSDNSRDFNWANISQEYKRDLSDWKRLCRKCHWEFDRPYRNKIVRLLKTPEFCNRGHRQTLDNIYKRNPRTPGLNIQVRCRTCRTEDMRNFKVRHGARGASLGCT